MGCNTVLPNDRGTCSLKRPCPCGLKAGLFLSNVDEQPNLILTSGVKEGVRSAASWLILSLEFETLEKGHWNISETTTYMKRTQTKWSLTHRSGRKRQAGKVQVQEIVIQDAPVSIPLKSLAKQDSEENRKRGFTPSHCL